MMDSILKRRITLVAPKMDYKGTFIVKLQNRVYPALGLGYVASALEAAGYLVDYVDMFALNMTYKSLQKHLERQKPEYVGITTNLATIIPAKRVAQLARVANPRCVIIVGGINVELFPDEILGSKEFDIGVVGEGEETIVDLMDALENKKGLELVAGIIFKKNGTIQRTAERKPISNLDLILPPARHLMPLDRYRNPVSKRKVITTMLGSRGCPFNCLFCVKDRVYRARSPRNIVDEMESLNKKFGIKEVLFVDSTFTANKRNVIALCQEMINRKLRMIWEVSTRVDCIDKETLSWMKRAGCTRVQFGIESGNDHVLKTLRKGFSIKQVIKAMKLTKEIGIETLNMFIIGSPGETEATVKQTIDFSIRLDADFSVFIVASPSPGTDMFDMAVDRGITNSRTWKDFVSGNSEKIPHVVFETKELPRTKLKRLLKLAYLRFYLRPSYIIKRIRKITSFSELVNNLAGIENVLNELI